MATDPLFINASAGAPSYDANELRQLHALPFMYGGRAVGARQGVRPGGTQLQVTLVGSTITVAPGLFLLDPALTTTQGPYWAVVPAAENPTGGPLQAAHASNPRKDIVIARVYDHDEDTSGLRLARTEYIAGVAAPVPVEPTVPAGAFRLATIDVPAAPGAPVVTNNYPHTVAAGGVLPVRDAADEAALSPYDSLVIGRLDTGRIRARLAGGWSELFAIGWSVMDAQPVGAASGGADVGFVNTAAQPGGNPVGVTFVGPPSGNVYVSVAGFLEIATANTVHLGWEVRTGNVVGSGTLVDGPGDGLLIKNGALAATRRSHPIPVTPGDQYNARTVQWVSGGSGTVWNKRIDVDPVL